MSITCPHDYFPPPELCQIYVHDCHGRHRSRKCSRALSAPPVLVFPKWDAAEDGPCPRRVYRDSSMMDESGVPLEQGQPDGPACDPSPTPAALSSTHRGIVLHSTEKQAALPEQSIIFDAIFGARSSASAAFGPPGEAGYGQGWATTTTRESSGDSRASPRSATCSSTAREALVTTIILARLPQPGKRHGR